MIELTNVYAGYDKKTVLKALSVHFERGKLVSIIGPNGCGKSTLLKTVIGILRPTLGEISIDDMSVSSMKPSDIAKKIAYLSQGQAVPAMTVEQMVLHGRFPHLRYPRRYGDTDRAIAADAMRRVGIDTLAEKPMAALSGGMRQNAYIAMALTQCTDYILMDEPTTYLDIAHQLSLIKLLRSLAADGKGIVAVLHDLPLALSFSDAVVLMDGGKLLLFDTPDRVFASDAISKTFGVQLCRDARGAGYFYDYMEAKTDG